MHSKIINAIINKGWLHNWVLLKDTMYNNTRNDKNIPGLT